jgi:hypothetical protein
MDETRKTIMTAGVYLGDISLALAATTEELPSYVKGLDVSRLLPEGGEADAARSKVEQGLEERSEPGQLPESLVREILEAAITRGKFLSAGRCLDILGERDAHVDRHLARGLSKAGEGKFEEAAQAVVIAANLDSKDGLPPYQYTGPGLHNTCPAAPENCVTRLGGDNAVAKALKYLVQSEKVFEALVQITPEQRQGILPHVVSERDPHAAEFFASCEKAHHDLESAEREGIQDLKATVARVESTIKRFAEEVNRFSGAGGEQKAVLDRVARVAVGLMKEFGGAAELVDTWQFKRLTRRLEQLIESGQDLTAAGKSLARAASAGDVFGPVLSLIEELEDQDILKQVGDIESKLLSTQVTMLGRSVHSQEHWQYLRELALKYPSSPLMCCLRKIDDRWMVVPRWESPIAGMLKAHFKV